ncbi:MULTISPECIES: hypothetical protein [unclassified Microcoleus]|nr:MULTISPECIES: hypothetical protein [unclassified Microcoleus]
MITPILGLKGRGRYQTVNCQLSTVNCQLLKAIDSGAKADFFG